MLMYVGFFVAMEYLCCKKQINNMLMYEVPDADMMKYEILSHLSVVKRGYDSIYNQVEVVQCSLHNLKIACQ